MSTEHTPGPWVASQGTETEPERWTVVAENGPPWWIAVVENGQPGDSLETEAATARLIAAAPELLEALIELVSMTEGLVSMDTGDLPQARAAIAKATGKEIA